MKQINYLNLKTKSTKSSEEIDKRFKIFLLEKKFILDHLIRRHFNKWKSKCFSPQNARDYNDLLLDYSIPIDITFNEIHESIESLDLQYQNDQYTPLYNSFRPTKEQENRIKSAVKRIVSSTFEISNANNSLGTPQNLKETSIKMNKNSKNSVITDISYDRDSLNEALNGIK